MKRINLEALLSFYQENSAGDPVTVQPLRQLQRHEDCAFSANDGNEYVIVHDVSNDTYIALAMSIECGLGAVGGHQDFALESGRGDVLLAKRYDKRSAAFLAVLEIIAIDNQDF